MHLAVLHYHFDQGGVTQVVKNHLASLASLGAENPVDRVLLLHGGRAGGLPAELPLSPDVRSLESLEYDSAPTVDGRLAEAIDAQLRRCGLSPGDSVVHLHNHSIGKSASVTAAVGPLAAMGWRLLLQIHDFAEDFRPANYHLLHEALGDVGEAAYPTAPNIGYACLTAHDAQLLSEAGIAADVLPNPVTAPPQAEDRARARRSVAADCGLADGQPLLLYPVRGIRRKNLGEAALWAAAWQGRAMVLQTMPPASPRELPSYRAWQQTAQRLGLPLRLGAGAIRFADAIAASDAMLTTSVAEGFGMVFLEPWLAGRPLLGRDLPQVTADFRAAGIHFDDLYRSLPVPLQWIGADRVRADLMAAMARASRGLVGAATPSAVAKQVDRLLDGSSIDFGMLAPAAQAAVVERVAADPDGLPGAARQGLLLDRGLSGDGAGSEAEAGEVVANAEAIAAHYSLGGIGRRLAQVYDRLSRAVAGEVGSAPRGAVLLERLMRVDRLHPLRLTWDDWEAPAANRHE